MTDDHDFKALVRARMAKTGESYTAARSVLLRGSPYEPPTPGAVAAAEPAPMESRSSFSLAGDRSDLDQNLSALREMYAHTGVVVEDDALRVWLGEPPIFTITIPRSQIKSVERADDLIPGSNLGVHGSFGRWLVNGSYTGLVHLSLEPAVRADMRPSAAMDEQARARMPRLLRPLLGDRRPKVRELTISVDDPDQLLIALDIGP